MVFPRHPCRKNCVNDVDKISCSYLLFLLLLEYMFTKGQIRILLEFMKDSAKIIFGSLVIGIFAPSVSGEIPWITFAFGIAMTIVFLGIAFFLSNKLTRETI